MTTSTFILTFLMSMFVFIVWDFICLGDHSFFCDRYSGPPRYRNPVFGVWLLISVCLAALNAALVAGLT